MSNGILQIKTLSFHNRNRSVCMYVYVIIMKEKYIVLHRVTKIFFRSLLHFVGVENMCSMFVCVSEYEW